MKTVPVNLPRSSYEILIGENLLGRAAAFIAGRPKRESTVVVSDETVWALHGAALDSALRQAGVLYESILLPPGEDSKSLAALEGLYERFHAAGLGRGGLVAAFGGGVIGDLAGYAAASWMRGVDYIQIPTTLLAQVDSSVGGKTAVNLRVGKNLVGAFHQPRFVAADTALLETLPVREFRCGMAEVVKYGVLFSPELFSRLAAPPAKDALPAVIETCCALKSHTVQADERDTGQRMLLNLGHTFGHAIEQLGGYSTHNHGEAVAIGMVLAAAYGERAGLTQPGCAEKIAATLAAQGLPTRCPYPAGQMLPAMMGDKKNRDGGIDLILPAEIGKALIHHQSFEELQRMLPEVL